MRFLPRALRYPRRRGVAFGMSGSGACLTENWEQRISWATTATPQKRATPWEVERLWACHALKGAAANDTIRTTDATHNLHHAS